MEDFSLTFNNPLPVMSSLLSKLLAEARGESLIALQPQPILEVGTLHQSNRRAAPHGTDTDSPQGGDQGEALKLITAKGVTAIEMARSRL